jgi:hypothetical protein
MGLDLFEVLSRLVAVTGRIVMLARLRRQGSMIVFVYSLLDLVCHAMDAIEKSLQDGE